MLSPRQVRKALLLIAWFSKVRENEVQGYLSMTEHPGIVHIHTEVSVLLVLLFHQELKDFGYKSFIRHKIS